MHQLLLQEGTTLKHEQALEVVLSVLTDVLDDELNTDPSMELIGGDSLLDSMKLVQVCVALEDAADEAGFEFDWTSEDAMSKSRSMFRNISSLAAEFARQSEL